MSEKPTILSKFKEKRDSLLKQVKAAQKRLEELEMKRKMEIGELAIRCGLADIEDEVLKSAFEKIAKDNE